MHLFIRTQVGVLHPSMTLIQRSAGFSRRVPGIELKEGYSIDLFRVSCSTQQALADCFPVFCSTQSRRLILVPVFYSTSRHQQADSHPNIYSTYSRVKQASSQYFGQHTAESSGLVPGILLNKQYTSLADWFPSRYSIQHLKQTGSRYTVFLNTEQNSERLVPVPILFNIHRL